MRCGQCGPAAPSPTDPPELTPPTEPLATVELQPDLELQPDEGLCLQVSRPLAAPLARWLTDMEELPEPVDRARRWFLELGPCLQVLILALLAVLLVRWARG